MNTFIVGGLGRIRARVSDRDSVQVSSRHRVSVRLRSTVKVTVRNSAVLGLWVRLKTGLP